MSKYLGFVSENGDSAFFTEAEIKSIGIVTGEKYIVSNGTEPLTEVSGFSYAEFEIDKSGNKPHSEFGLFEGAEDEFRWLIKNQDNIVQVIVAEHGKNTYHLKDGQKLYLSVVAGDLFIEIR